MKHAPVDLYADGESNEGVVARVKDIHACFAYEKALRRYHPYRELKKEEENERRVLVFDNSINRSVPS